MRRLILPALILALSADVALAGDDGPKVSAETLALYAEQDAYWARRARTLRELGSEIKVVDGREVLVDRLYPETLPKHRKRIWVNGHPPEITPEMRAFFRPLTDRQIRELWRSED